MSHFSQVKTNLLDKTVLQTVLKKMGFVVEDTGVKCEVRGYFGETIPADFKVLTETHYDIGFVRDASGNYEVVADWELMPRVSGIEQNDFVAKLKREYAKEAIMQTAKLQGYEVECVENEDGTSVEMVVTQW